MNGYCNLQTGNWKASTSQLIETGLVVCGLARWRAVDPVKDNTGKKERKKGRFDGIRWHSLAFIGTHTLFLTVPIVPVRLIRPIRPINSRLANPVSFRVIPCGDWAWGGHTPYSHISFWGVPYPDSLGFTFEHGPLAPLVTQPFGSRLRLNADRVCSSVGVSWGCATVGWSMPRYCPLSRSQAAGELSRRKTKQKHPPVA